MSEDQQEKKKKKERSAQDGLDEALGAARAEKGTGSSIEASAQTTVWATLRRGLELSPQIRQGLGVTLALAVVATLGRVVVPVTVQRTIDSGINAEGGPDIHAVTLLVGGATLVVLLTGFCSYVVNLRLFRATEAGLAQLRTTAFRRVHDLSVLTQNTERRGALVSRVTSDVDTISQFMQFGGLMLILSFGQLVVATVLMAVYSWSLTLIVLAMFVPLVLFGRWMQRFVSAAYGRVRERVGDVLGAISETVVGADTIRAYAVEERTGRRVEESIERHRLAARRAQNLVSFSFSSGVLVSGLVVAVVVLAGTFWGVGGDISLGELLAFLFLVQIFTGPVMSITEMLNELQNAVAGWRRVLAVLDTPADVADPGEAGTTLPRGPITVEFDDVTFAYPGGEPVLREVSLTIAPRTKVAVVGETGSGKTTLAKLLTRLQDPGSGRVLLDGVDLRDLRFSSLRERVVMVPQEGFLFDDTLLHNIRYGRPGASDADVELAITELGLDEWVSGLPKGLQSRVGQRGESLSAGERQLVALARAYLADPDLLVLDEATSAVDPATEVRLQRALNGVTTGRTAVTIAHRMSTAEVADKVVVVDAGRVVEVGRHDDLVDAGGVYSRLHASWSAQLRSV
jgi:putative ABC transport system ATP-binding protein